MEGLLDILMQREGVTNRIISHSLHKDIKNKYKETLKYLSGISQLISKLSLHDNGITCNYNVLNGTLKIRYKDNSIELNDLLYTDELYTMLKEIIPTIDDCILAKACSIHYLKLDKIIGNTLIIDNWNTIVGKSNNIVKIVKNLMYYDKQENTLSTDILLYPFREYVSKEIKDKELIESIINTVSIKIKEFPVIVLPNRNIIKLYKLKNRTVLTEQDNNGIYKVLSKNNTTGEITVEENIEMYKLILR